MVDLNILFRICLASFVLVLGACGGGGSSNNSGSVGAAPPPAISTGSLTLLVGDGPIDAVDEVNIVISEIILIGGDDGQESVFEGEIGPINLLDLRNITELLFDGDVPAGDYSKIRLRITSLEIVEGATVSDVQLPANGRIDLNPQGSFNIAPGEDLVIQIDFDLDRSIHIVQTGNSQYRFRPVVFVDIIDQTDQLRLTRLFGTVVADGAGEETSDFDLCEPAVGDAEQVCHDVVFGGPGTILDADGAALETIDTLLDGTAHLFGHFFIGAEGGSFFRAKMVVQGDEASIESITGDVETAVIDESFDLLTIDFTDPFNVMISDALLLDDVGNALEVEIEAGQEAEAWAQQNVLATQTEPQNFPAFLVQVSPGEADDSLLGTLFAVTGDEITLVNDDGEVCVLNVAETVIQHVITDADGSESMDITMAQLAELVGTDPSVEAFGSIDGECLVADTIVVETEG